MRKSSFVIILGLLICRLAFANYLFDTVCHAIKDSATSLKLYSLERGHVGKQINGRGYVLEVNTYLPGSATVRLSLEKDYLSKDSVYVTIFLAKDQLENVRKINLGESVYFSGTLLSFSSIEKNIFVHNGFVTRGQEILRKNGVIYIE
ncbi:MAG: hypothetical protein ABH872_01275 [Candidatus Omnitrophota bacterium]